MRIVWLPLPSSPSSIVMCWWFIVGGFPLPAGVLVFTAPILQLLWSTKVKFVSLSRLLGWPLFGSNTGLFTAPGFIVSLSDFSMSSTIFGVQSSYMLEYRWLFALSLRSGRRFTGAHGDEDSAPTYLSAIFSHIPFPSFLWGTNLYLGKNKKNTLMLLVNLYKRVTGHRVNRLMWNPQCLKISLFML